MLGFRRDTKFVNLWLLHLQVRVITYYDRLQSFTKHIFLPCLIRLGKIDLNESENKSIGGKFGVRGYPTIKIFRNGDAFDYSGPRDAEGIATFLKNERMKVGLGVGYCCRTEEFGEAGFLLIAPPADKTIILCDEGFDLPGIILIVLLGFKGLV